jgi:hypothetical protein
VGTAPIELDHLFVMVRPNAPEASALSPAGLCESFRRDHPGQGTTNLCYWFDNAYLELLWLRDRAEAASPAVARMRLPERADWQTSGASPFGIALRTGRQQSLPFETWGYTAPFLPAGATIPVAVASDDPRQPLLFRSPGSQRPDRWTDGRAGVRQGRSGLAEIAHLRLDFPPAVTPAQPFVQLREIGLLSLGHAAGARMVLTLSRRDGSPRSLALPALTWSD